MKCDKCTEKCPQEELACEIAKGRMYATKEAIELQKELQSYKEAEEQGLLLKLPCKVGTMVWLTAHDGLVRKERPLMCNVDEFIMQGNICYAVLNANEPFYALHIFKAINIMEFGLTIFLTKEAAEQALKQMGE